MAINANPNPNANPSPSPRPIPALKSNICMYFKQMQLAQHHKYIRFPACLFIILPFCGGLTALMAFAVAGSLSQSVSRPF